MYGESEYRGPLTHQSRLLGSFLANSIGRGLLTEAPKIRRSDPQVSSLLGTNGAFLLNATIMHYIQAYYVALY